MEDEKRLLLGLPAKQSVLIYRWDLERFIEENPLRATIWMSPEEKLKREKEKQERLMKQEKQ